MKKSLVAGVALLLAVTLSGCFGTQKPLF